MSLRLHESSFDKLVVDIIISIKYLNHISRQILECQQRMFDIHQLTHSPHGATQFNDMI